MPQPKRNFPAKLWIGHGLLIQAVFAFVGGWLAHAHGPYVATGAVFFVIFVRKGLIHSTYDLIRERSEGILPKNWLAVVPKEKDEKKLAKD